MRLTNFGPWYETAAFYNEHREIETDDPITAPAALVVVVGSWHQTPPPQAAGEDAQGSSTKMDRVQADEGCFSAGAGEALLG